MTFSLSGDQALIADSVGWTADDYSWTEFHASSVLPPPDVGRIVRVLTNELTANNISFPDQERLLSRCVTALHVGHLILQGPPGSGKTTLARALSAAFSMELVPSTASSDWSPFHVVGGLQPNRQGGFSSKLGVVPSAVLRCAELVRGSGDDATFKGAWLLIDEFNRADVDKAIGSLYTFLSSCDPEHVAATPLELWFESSEATKRMWAPALFRIIGTMNDLDTNYVSQMSQGLRRRFQFITVNVPSVPAEVDGSITVELREAYTGASRWLEKTYGLEAPDLENSEIITAVKLFQSVLHGFRRPTVQGVDGWPVGTAQVVDVLRSFLLAGWTSDGALDTAIGDRLVGQMNTLSESQYKEFRATLHANGLKRAVQDLDHLWKPYSVGA
mgnify:CR=1 FL=1